MANSVDTEHSAQEGAVWSGSALSLTLVYKMLGHLLSARDDFQIFWIIWYLFHLGPASYNPPWGMRSLWGLPWPGRAHPDLQDVREPFSLLLSPLSSGECCMAVHIHRYSRSWSQHTYTQLKPNKTYTIITLDIGTPYLGIHYENTPIHIHWEFYHQKNENFQREKIWYFSYFCSKHRL